MIPACKEQVESQQNKALIDFDRFDSIIFGIICHPKPGKSALGTRLITSIILIYFPKKALWYFELILISFKIFDFLNLENSGTNLKNTILATWTPG